MAHPDHDQFIGRLAGARLRGTADRRAVSGAAAEAHPDAETWAAYVDGGLQADEVVGLETHLAGCPACRHLVAALVPEVSSGAASGVREVEAPAAERGVVIPFPRRRVFVWMAAAAGLLMAVTIWSVSRLADRPAMSVAMSTREAGAPVPPPPPPASPPADTAGGNALRMRIPDSKAVDQAAGQAPPMEEARATSEQDKRKPDARSDALRQQTEFAAAEAKQTAPVATTAGNAREIQLQTNTAAGVARPRGPVPSQQAIQQANQQAGNQPQYAQAETPVAAPAAPTTAGAAAPVPATAPAPAPVAAPVPPPARTEAAVTDARERRANEEPGGLTESVSTTTSTRAGARRTAPPSQAERGQAAGGDREGQARSKDEPTFKALGSVAAASAVSSFAEPGGRLQWRIADGRRLESSSDGGATWTGRYTAGDRLRAGIAPAIDSAWAVGERGLVLRLTVPGGWTPVSRPVAATLIAVSATGSQVARVTADDGRVFETIDGGATWTPATPGAGPR